MTINKIYSIITAAGESEGSFLSAGFNAPKNLLVMEGRTILCRSITSYAQDLSLTTVALSRDECHKWQTVDALRYCAPEVDTVLVSSKVLGALVSSVLATHSVPMESPLVVCAGDSEITGGISDYLSQFQCENVDAATIVFQSKEPRWSYISVGEDGLVRQVAEKRVIGPLATTGVFYFRSAETFLRAAKWCFTNKAVHLGQYYVSTTLNALIMEGLRVSYVEIPRNEYRSWSLPIDFIAQSR